MNRYIMEINPSEPNCGLCGYIYKSGDVMWRLAPTEISDPPKEPPYISLCMECLVNIQTLDQTLEIDDDWYKKLQDAYELY